MRWPVNENIVRVDGKDKCSMLILRESMKIDRKYFTHDYLSGLLRSAIVASISALDRYLHDLIVENSIRMLNSAEKDVPTELKKLKIPLLATKKALDRARKAGNTRPGHIIKQQIQEVLHREYTFQNPTRIEKALKMLGIKDIWREISKKMSSKPQPGEVQESLRRITNRRHQIVHEADLILKTKARKISVREIKYSVARDAVDWIKEFVGAIHTVTTN